jgi:hypothetical protein
MRPPTCWADDSVKRKLPIIAAAVLIGTLVYFYGAGRTPSGQPPLVPLSAGNLSSIRDSFNAARADVRVLLLLSPT